MKIAAILLLLCLLLCGCKPQPPKTDVPDSGEVTNEGAAYLSREPHYRREGVPSHRYSFVDYTDKRDENTDRLLAEHYVKMESVPEEYRWRDRALEGMMRFMLDDYGELTPEKLSFVRSIHVEYECFSAEFDEEGNFISDGSLPQSFTVAVNDMPIWEWRKYFASEGAEYYIPTGDLTYLDDMVRFTNLGRIFAFYHKVTDVSPLKNCDSLYEAVFTYGTLTDISELSYLDLAYVSNPKGSFSSLLREEDNPYYYGEHLWTAEMTEELMAHYDMMKTVPKEYRWQDEALESTVRFILKDYGEIKPGSFDYVEEISLLRYKDGVYDSMNDCMRGDVPNMFDARFEGEGKGFGANTQIPTERIRSLADLPVYFPNLKALYISDTDVADLSPIKRLGALESLQISNCIVKDAKESEKQDFYILSQESKLTP